MKGIDSSYYFQEKKSIEILLVLENENKINYLYTSNIKYYRVKDPIIFK